MTHPIIERLRGGSVEERRRACLDAADDPSAILLLDALVEALGDPSKRVAQAASDAVAGLAGHGPEVGERVRAALRSEVPMRRWFAAFTSSRIEPPSPRLIPVLVDAFASDEGDIRWAAARLLVNTGRVCPEVLPVLLGLAGGDHDPTTRAMASYCLRELAPDEPRCARVLVDASRDPDPQLRRAALSALASLRDPPRAVYDRLTESIADSSDAVDQRVAIFSLGALGEQHELPPAAVALLRDVAHDSPVEELRAAAERELARLGASAASGRTPASRPRPAG